MQPGGHGSVQHGMHAAARHLANALRNRRWLHRLTGWLLIAGLVVGFPVTGLIGWSQLFPASIDYEFSLQPHSYLVRLWRGQLHATSFMDFDVWYRNFNAQFANLPPGIAPPLVFANTREWTVDLNLIVTLAGTALACSFVLCIWLLSRNIKLPGHCPTCGYNLHLNTTNRCPECGQTAPPALSSALPFGRSPRAFAPNGADGSLPPVQVAVATETGGTKPPSIKPR